MSVILFIVVTKEGLKYLRITSPLPQSIIAFHRCYGLLKLNYGGFEYQGTGEGQESNEISRV